EPDYVANTAGVDLSQDVFGGMTTVALGFTLGDDQVGKHGEPEFSEKARHWQYRLGLTQILTPRWVASPNLKAVPADGFPGRPYRGARVFGATVPARMPRTRESRALRFGVAGDITPQAAEGAAEPARSSVHAEYRYFWDTWNIRAHTLEAGYSRYFGQK